MMVVMVVMSVYVCVSVTKAVYGNGLIPMQNIDVR